MRRTLTLAVFACVIAVVTACILKQQRDESSAGTDVVSDRLWSAVLGEQRPLLVHLPESYQRDATRRYPVLYVLDGSSQGVHTARSARLLARTGALPELIVVGVPNTSAKGRQRDYTPPYMRLEPDQKESPVGAADRFLQFLHSELIPHIERAYRTTSTRMLAGNSRGGLFVVYSLVERPDLFDARFAFSAPVWREDARLVTELGKALPSTVTGPTFLYLSVGGRETENMTRGFQKAVEVCKRSARPGFHWHADVTEGADHQDNAALSTPVALQEYYRKRT